VCSNLLRNEDLGAENRILRGQIKDRLLLSEGEKATLAEIAYRLGREALGNISQQRRTRIRFSAGTENLSLANCYFAHSDSPSCYDSARRNLLVLFILWFAKAAAETQNGTVLGRVVLLRCRFQTCVDIIQHRIYISYTINNIVCSGFV
jgi:hypothetical protein